MSWSPPQEPATYSRSGTDGPRHNVRPPRMTRDRELAAYQYAQDRKALVGVVVLILLLFLLDRCAFSPDRDWLALAEMAALGTASASQTSTSTESPPQNEPPADPGSDGTLTAGGTSLLPLSEAAAADGSLSEYAGEAALGSGMTVWSVPADEGFWVGTSDTDRVWVQLIGPVESPYAVRAGDTVSFTGVVVVHAADFPSRVGAGKDEGADLLAAQGAHIEVPMDELILRK